MGAIPDDLELRRWAEAQPAETTEDPVWKLAAFRHAVFVASLARDDAELLARDPLKAAVAAQLLRSATSIAANVAEGYGRPTTVDRIRFMSYALGSAREAAIWYEAAGKSIPSEALGARRQRLARVKRIIIGLIRRLRTKTSREPDRW